MGTRGALNGEMGSQITVPPIDFFEGLDRIKKLPLIKKCKTIRAPMHKHNFLGVLFPYENYLYAYWGSGFCCLLRGPLGGGVTDRRAAWSAMRSC